MVILRKEKLDWVVFVEIVFCLIGVLFVAKPPFFLKLLNQEVPAGSEHDLHLLGIAITLFTTLTFAIQ
jgi:drug/metabolite transporter (DMT)-like permease